MAPEPNPPPEPLPYAAGRAHGLRAALRSHKRSVAAAAGLLIVLLLVAWGTDTGRGSFQCRICHARWRTKWFYVFDMGGRYNLQVTEGAVSRLIQAQVTGPCMHSWEYAHGTRRTSIIGGARELGSGFRSFGLSGRLDDNGAELLEERARSDPSFVPQLKKALDDPDAPANEAWLNQLMADIYDRSESQPATGPTGPR